MIIDFRLRPPFKGFRSTLMWDVERTKTVNTRRGYTPSESICNASMDSLFSEMKQTGITLGVAAGRDPQSTIGGIPNEEIVELQRTHPDYFVGCPSVDTMDPKRAADEIDRYVLEFGAKGIVVEPGVAPTPLYPSDSSLFPIYEQCALHNVAVLVMGGGNAGPDISYSDPVHLDRLAAAFPKVKFVATHGGWPFVQQILGVAFRRPNVYVCPDMYLLNSPGCQDYVAAANNYMQDQFLFATSYPFSPLKEYLDGFLKLDFRSEVLDKLLYQNARNVLGI